MVERKGSVLRMAGFTGLLLDKLGFMRGLDSLLMLLVCLDWLS